MTTRRDLKTRENELARLLAGQFTVQSRLTQMRDELGIMMRNLDRLVLPRSQRRRSTRKTFVDRAGNVVVFPRGDQ